MNGKVINLKWVIVTEKISIYLKNRVNNLRLAKIMFRDDKGFIRNCYCIFSFFLKWTENLNWNLLQRGSIIDVNSLLFKPAQEWKVLELFNTAHSEIHASDGVLLDGVSFLGELDEFGAKIGDPKIIDEEIERSNFFCVCLDSVRSVTSCVDREEVYDMRFVEEPSIYIKRQEYFEALLKDEFEKSVEIDILIKFLKQKIVELDGGPEVKENPEMVPHEQNKEDFLELDIDQVSSTSESEGISIEYQEKNYKILFSEKEELIESLDGSAKTGAEVEYQSDIKLSLPAKNIRRRIPTNRYTPS